MDFDAAVDALRSYAEQCLEREDYYAMRVGEAMSCLKYLLGRSWLVDRYEQALLLTRQSYQDKVRRREALRVATRGIQQACAAKIAEQMTSLADPLNGGIAKNKTEIERRRQMLAIVRKPVGR